MQKGGPDSELGAATRYLSQRYSMPTEETRALLTDIGTEELAHWEILGAMIRQCLKGAPISAVKAAGMEAYYVDHDSGVYPCSSAGVPFTTAALQVKGDPIADLTEDMAAEQKARATYEHILRLADDPDIKDPISFLRMREVVHFQRFGEALDKVQAMMNKKGCK